MRKIFLTALVALLLFAGATEAQTVVVGRAASELPKYSDDPYTCDATTEGHIYWNTTTKLKMQCDGTSWVAAGTGATSFVSLTDVTNGTPIDFSGAVDDDVTCFDTISSVVTLVPCKNGIPGRTDSASPVVLLSTDRGKYVNATNASAKNVTIDAAGSAGFAAGYMVWVRCPTSAGACTILPTTSQINGAASLVLYPGDSAVVISRTEDAHYDAHVFRGMGFTNIWLEAGGCQNTTAFLNWDTPTSNPAVAACVTGTNTQKGVADFADGANTLSMQRTLMLPSDWTSTIDVTLKWFTSATSATNVVWQVATSCVADAETDDPSWNTASTVTDATKGTTNQTNDASITSLTVTGCAAGELMHLKVLRDPTHASDDLAATARLIGVMLKLRRTL